MGDDCDDGRSRWETSTGRRLMRVETIVVDTANAINRLTERLDIMADALSDAFAALSTKVDAAIAADQAGSAELADLVVLVQGMQPGTTLTAETITALATRLDTATSALAGQTAASATATDPASVPQPPTSTPGEPGPQPPVTPDPSVPVDPSAPVV
jgi:hypothetical protein